MNPTPTISTSDRQSQVNANQPGMQMEFIHRAAWKAGMLGSINVLVKVLAARFVVLVAIIGGIALAFPALNQPDWFRVMVLAVYCAGVVLPVAVLSALGRL